MGWSKGKGLGKHEDGNRDHIKVSYKNDSKGMGFKGYDDAWVAHQDDFNALLTSLHEANPDEDGDHKAKAVELKSLEEKSLKSRKRVHYHKFIRGKDLSKRSAKDLQCIFGKRDASAKSTPIEELPDTCDAEEADKNIVSNGSSFTIESGSMQLYFAQKLSKLQNQPKLGYVQESQTAVEDETTSKLLSNSTDPNSCENGNIDVGVERLNKKKRKRDRVLFADCDSENKIYEASFTNKEFCVSSIQEEVQPILKTKKKKSRKAEVASLDDSQPNGITHSTKDDKEKNNLLDGRAKKHKHDNGLKYLKNGSSCLEVDTSNSSSVPISKAKTSEKSVLDIKKKRQKRENLLEPSGNDHILRVNENRRRHNVCDVYSTNDSRTVALNTLSQADVATMRNATLDVLCFSKQQNNKLVCRDDKLPLEVAVGQDQQCDSVNRCSPSKVIAITKTAIITDDTRIKVSSGGSNKLDNVASCPSPPCNCKSGYGAYDRLPWEILNSLGYFRKLINPENKFLVECMRKRMVFNNSNIFEIKGYEVLPSFDCCCAKS